MTPITSTVRDDLHWLPVESRIRFKRCLLLYKSLHGTAPEYIAEMCIRRSFDTEHYQLRSAVRGELCCASSEKSNSMTSQVRYAGPSLWNALPQGIRDLSLSLPAHFSLNSKRICIAKFDCGSAFVMTSS